MEVTYKAILSSVDLNFIITIFYHFLSGNMDKGRKTTLFSCKMQLLLSSGICSLLQFTYRILFALFGFITISFTLALPRVLLNVEKGFF